MDFNPASTVHRKVLAQDLLRLLTSKDFCEAYVKKPVAGRTFYRLVSEAPGVRVSVETTVEGYDEDAEVQLLGKVPIQVRALYRNKDREDREIFPMSTVTREGTFEGVAEAVLTTMRDVYVRAATQGACTRCGAPLFLSKNNNLVCGEICFKNR